MGHARFHDGHLVAAARLQQCAATAATATAAAAATRLQQCAAADDGTATAPAESWRTWRQWRRRRASSTNILPRRTPTTDLRRKPAAAAATASAARCSPPRGAAGSAANDGGASCSSTSRFSRFGTGENTTRAAVVPSHDSCPAATALCPAHSDGNAGSTDGCRVLAGARHVHCAAASARAAGPVDGPASTATTSVVFVRPAGAAGGRIRLRLRRGPSDAPSGRSLVAGAAPLCGTRRDGTPPRCRLAAAIWCTAAGAAARAAGAVRAAARAAAA